MVSFIFVGFNFHGLTDTGMFVDILIHGFDTCKLLLMFYVGLLLCAIFCGLGIEATKTKKISTRPIKTKLEFTVFSIFFGIYSAIFCTIESKR